MEYVLSARPSMTTSALPSGNHPAGTGHMAMPSSRRTIRLDSPAIVATRRSQPLSGRQLHAMYAIRRPSGDQAAQHTQEEADVQSKSVRCVVC